MEVRAITKRSLVDVADGDVDKDRSVVREGAPGDIRDGTSSLGRNTPIRGDEQVVNMAGRVTPVEGRLRGAHSLIDSFKARILEEAPLGPSREALVLAAVSVEPGAVKVTSHGSRRVGVLEVVRHPEATRGLNIVQGVLTSSFGLLDPGFASAPEPRGGLHQLNLLAR